jgi:thiamine biosynthesis lipoprotein
MKKEKIGDKSVFRFSHEAMGTLFEIFLTDIDENYARQVSQAVFKEIDRLENLLSRFNPSSDIGQINNLKPGQTCSVQVDVFECLQKAAHIQHVTREAFAINYASPLRYLRKQKTACLPIKMSRISGRFNVTFEKKEDFTGTESLMLDLGGIGKGFALDKTTDLLLDWDVSKALIHSGTSTALAVGAPEGKEGWAIGVSGSRDSAFVPGKIMVKNRAVSGSGKQVKGEHIIDPRTGAPASGHESAWVSHPSAATADALSTAFVVMKTPEVKTFCLKNKQVWAAVAGNDRHCKIFNQNSI